MTTALQALTMALVALAGTAVAVTRQPVRQAMVASVFGLLLVVLFAVYQAPDAALSAIVVSSFALPLMVLLALARARSGRK